jgi:superfamily I DNA/RNA helicase
MTSLTVPLLEVSDTDFPGKGIRYCTVSSFKGMESDVVVLVNVDDLHSPEARQALYVGLSRSRAVLAVFMSEAVRDEYEDLASEFGERLAATGTSGAPQS